jgi:hypothetical protein
MIFYTQHQKRFLKKVASLFPPGTKNEFWGLVQQQIADETCPSDNAVLSAAAIALDRHSFERAAQST